MDKETHSNNTVTDMDSTERIIMNTIEIMFRGNCLNKKGKALRELRLKEYSDER